MSPRKSTKKVFTTCARSVFSKNTCVSVASSFADTHKPNISEGLLVCIQQTDHAGVVRLLQDASQSLGFFDVALAWLFTYEQSSDDLVDIMDHYLQSHAQQTTSLNAKEPSTHQKGYQQRSLLATFFIESTLNMLDRFAQRLPSLKRLHSALVTESIMAENAWQKSVPRSLLSFCVYRKNDAMLLALRSIVPKCLDIVGPDGYTLVMRSVVHHDDVFVHWAMDALPPCAWFATHSTGHSGFSLAFRHGNIECVSLLMHHYGAHEALQQAVVGDGQTITPALAAFFSCTNTYFTAQLSQSLCMMLFAAWCYVGRNAIALEKNGVKVFIIGKAEK